MEKECDGNIRNIIFSWVHILQNAITEALVKLKHIKIPLGPNVNIIHMIFHFSDNILLITEFNFFSKTHTIFNGING